MEPQTWLIYLLATTGLSLSPGPNSLLALTHGALHGWRRTLFTIAGGAVGFVVLIGLSLFGIGALLKASPMGLVALKWVGGAYLVWLGVQVWRSPPIGASLGAGPASGLAAGPGANAATDAAGPSPTGGALAWQGALAALTNPKGVLFFAAFLPQFIDPARDLLTQFIIMATVFVAVEILVEYLLALLAHRVRPWLERAGRNFNRVCGGMFAAMGVALPLTR